MPDLGCAPSIVCRSAVPWCDNAMLQCRCLVHACHFGECMLLQVALTASMRCLGISANLAYVVTMFMLLPSCCVVLCCNLHGSQMSVT